MMAPPPRMANASSRLMGWPARCRRARSTICRRRAAAYWLVDPDVPSLTCWSSKAASMHVNATAVGNEAWESQTPIHAIITPSRLVD